jgi:hypothetical protein
MQLCVDLFLSEKRYAVAARYLKAWRDFELEDEHLHPYVVLDTMNALESVRSKLEQREKRSAAKAAREAANPRSDSGGQAGRMHKKADEDRAADKDEAAGKDEATRKDKAKSPVEEDPRQLRLF